MAGSSLTSDRLLYGSTGVPLAPVRGVDTRGDLPESLFAKRPGRFTAKFAFVIGLIEAGWVAIALSRSWPVIILAMIVNGNDLHRAHHFHQGIQVPRSCRDLHDSLTRSDNGGGPE